MHSYSANLGFLWTQLSLSEAIYAAKEAGFAAVECHWPYSESVDDVNVALKETSLPMLSLNTQRGNIEQGDNGLCALPGRELEARQAIDEAIDYASLTNTKNIHIMPGIAHGDDARRQFIANLKYALNKTQSLAINLLIEPLNNIDAPNYFLSSTTQAESIIQDVGSDRLKLMFDCYHIQIMQGSLPSLIKHHLNHIGHIQFASVPDRGPPDSGEIDYPELFSYIRGLGYSEPLGAEYKAGSDTNATLEWLKHF